MTEARLGCTSGVTSADLPAASRFDLCWSSSLLSGFLLSSLPSVSTRVVYFEGRPKEIVNSFSLVGLWTPLSRLA